MFVIIVNYIVPMEVMERHLEAHRQFLDEHYTSGHLIASGPQVPRKGGIILCKATSREEVESIVSQDPFNRNKVAQYTIIEFEATKYIAGLDEYLC